MRAAACAVAIALALAFQAELARGATCSSKTNENIRIVLDVGHTATHAGATSARGVGEYDFNLILARRIKEELIRAGFPSTYLIVTELDGRRGLRQRARRANAMNADIFVSVHHDGVLDKYLVPWLYQGEEHFYFDDSKGFSLHVSPRNPRYGESLQLAQILADKLMESGLEFTAIHAPSRPEGARVPFLDSGRGIYRREKLIVLNKTEMPAVLLEAGVIVNRDEELALASPARQATTAKAVVEAVRKFCGDRFR